MSISHTMTEMRSRLRPFLLPTLLIVVAEMAGRRRESTVRHGRREQSTVKHRQAIDPLIAVRGAAPEDGR